MQNLKYSVGIDVSKDSLHCCLSVIDEEQCVSVKASHLFTNTPKGFIALLSWAIKNKKEDLPLVFVMEATGIYHEQLAWYLFKAKQTVSVVLATTAKRYLQGNGSKSKNDMIDSRGLSRMGAEKKLVVWEPLSEEIYILRAYTRQHQSLNELHTSTNNQLHSIQHSQNPSKLVIKQLQASCRLIKKQINELEAAIKDLIKKDLKLNRKRECICSIKGISDLTFAVIIAETNGFALFANIAQVISYAGLDVIDNQSGKHTGRTKISKRGNPRIRRILHMPSLVATRSDQPQFWNLYNRVYERTRIKMKGYVAVQKKLLQMIYCLWNTEKIYESNYQKLAVEPEVTIKMA